jgi:hypothetical protein
MIKIRAAIETWHSPDSGGGIYISCTTILLVSIIKSNVILPLIHEGYTVILSSIFINNMESRISYIKRLIFSK